MKAIYANVIENDLGKGRIGGCFHSRMKVQKINDSSFS